MREREIAVARPERSGVVPAALIADCAGDRLPASLRGRVHSVFDRACNIDTDAGELVTLLAPASGNLPHGIRLAGSKAPFRFWLFPGQTAMLQNATLHLPDSDVSIDLSAAARWGGKVAHVCTGSDSARFAAGLRALRATVVERAPAQGIALLHAHPDGASSAIARALANRMSQTLPMLVRATQRRDVSAIAEGAARLVGLGPGLTPSGDDFIAGYLAALWSRAGFESDLDAILSPLADSLVPLFLRTHAISRQMLNDAVQGHFAERLADVTLAIAVAGDVVGATARALVSGHSSGADTLCGLLFGYAPDLALRALSSPPRRIARPMHCHYDAGCTAAIA